MIVPCPRCGAEEVYPESFTPWGLYCAKCQWCGPRAHWNDWDQAISAWNAEARKIAEARAMGLAVNLDQPPLDADDTA